MRVDDDNSERAIAEVLLVWHVLVDGDKRIALSGEKPQQCSVPKAPS
jgi:hypothetical protein